MGAETEIAWTDHTFNPWWGCQRVSPGCEHCYAEAWDARFGGEHWGAKSERRFFGEKHWNEPRKWNKAAREAGVRKRVFCASMADVFEARDDLNGERLRLWCLIEETPWLDWQLLTKRPENVTKILTARWLAEPRPNVWLGTTVEDQARADERIPHLLRTPAAVRFLSCEPLLGPVDLTGHGYSPDPREGTVVPLIAGIDWVIVGGESDPGARPMFLEWARSIIEQCRAAGVRVFTKQLGSVWARGMVKLGLGVNNKGGDPAEWSPELRVREWPEVSDG